MILTNKKNSFFLSKIFISDMEVLASKASCSEYGTFYQLRNSIHCSNVVKLPIDSFDDTHNFFTLVVEAYILVAAMKVFEMDSLESVPSEKLVPEGANSWMLEDNECQRMLDSQLLKVFLLVNFIIRLPLTTILMTKCCYIPNIYLLLDVFLILGVLRCSQKGDRSTILISSGKKNCAVKSMHLLMQHDYLLSPREDGELVWSRFMNVRGCPGQNIPNDYIWNILNRVCKNAMTGLGANKTPQSISRISNALGTIIPVLDNFDDNNAVTLSSRHHNPKYAAKDLTILIDVLQKASVFANKGKQCHASFLKPRNPLHSIASNDLTKRIVDHIHFQILQFCHEFHSHASTM